MEEFILTIPKQYPMTDDELFAFCAANKELRIERNEKGQLIVMSPSGGATSNRNFRLTAMLGAWVEENLSLGYGFDSNAGFRLNDNSMRAPDAAWIRKEKWDAITFGEQEKFARVCPDFIVELRSPSDSLPGLKRKMTKWIENGASLAWLIDPQEEKVYIYRPNQAVEEITGFNNRLSGESLLPGFELDLSRLR